MTDISVSSKSSSTSLKKIPLESQKGFGSASPIGNDTGRAIQKAENKEADILEATGLKVNLTKGVMIDMNMSPATGKVSTSSTSSIA